MKRKQIALLSILLLTCSLLGGCSGKSDVQEPATEVSVTESEEPSEGTDAEKEAETEAESETDAKPAAELPDGIYRADFDTDSTMFHVNEACEGKGILTVRDGNMTIHVSLTSQNILNLYPGFAEDAAKDGAVLLEPDRKSVV